MVEEPSPTRIEMPNARQAQQLVARTRKTIADLPAPPKECNVLGVVLAYRMFGLSDQEIALALNTTIERVSNIMMLDEFEVLREAVIQGIIDKDADNIRQRVAAHQDVALNQVVELMTTAEQEAVRMRASERILDMGGNSVKQIIEHNVKIENELRIVEVDATQTYDDMEVIDGTLSE